MSVTSLSDIDRRPNGAALLDEVRAAVTRYVALPSVHVEVGVTLWIAATHAVDALNTAPRLAIRSPEKRCGKSRLLDLVGALCRNPLPTANVSSAVLYRVMGGKNKPTLIIDEADTIWGNKKSAEQNEDLRGLVNAGFERGRPTLRYNAASREVEELATFGFVALAGIGKLPDTITDRAVNITMRRRRAGERVDPFRSRRDGQPLHRLRERLGVWVESRLSEMETAEPELPVEDRAADVWEALVVVADAAGGHWPVLARDAAKALTAEQEEEDHGGSDSLRLLADVRQVFAEVGSAFLESRDLVLKLRGIDEAPWGEYDLTVMKLAERLKAYKIAPRRNPAGTKRGYRLEDFSDTFARYLATATSEAVRTSEAQVNGTDGSDVLTGQGVRTSDATPVLSRESDNLTASDDCPRCGFPYDSNGHAATCQRAAA